MLKEILRKLEEFDNRLGAIESWSHLRMGKGEESGEEEEEQTRKVIKRADWSEERVTRQTKEEFPVFDGNRVQD